MGQLTLADLSKKIAEIDFAMLSTHTPGGEIASRPMSNNGDVEYKGDSYFFAHQSTHSVSQIESNPKVTLNYAGAKSLLGKPGIFIAIEGRGEIIRDKVQFKEHWAKDVERYFPEGIDTPGLTLIKVHATRIHYWDGEDEGEVSVPA
jgi:general stress protein 26